LAGEPLEVKNFCEEAIAKFLFRLTSKKTTSPFFTSSFPHFEKNFETFLKKLSAIFQFLASLSVGERTDFVQIPFF